MEVPPVESRHSTIPPRSVTPSTAQAVPPAASGLYRCKQGGRVTYQAEPCAHGMIQSEVDKGSVSVVDGSRVAKSQLARVQAMRQEVAGRQEAAFGEIGAAQPEASDYRCHYLHEALENVDARGRRRNTSATLEWLRKERRELVEAMHELKCPRIPPM
jgi:hypothetical protein